MVMDQDSQSNQGAWPPRGGVAAVSTASWSSSSHSSSSFLCQLCRVPRGAGPYHCAQCVTHGLVGHSDARQHGTLGELRARRLELGDRCRRLRQQIEARAPLAPVALREDLEETTRSVRRLKDVLGQKRANLDRLLAEATAKRRVNVKRQQRLPLYQDKCQSMLRVLKQRLEKSTEARFDLHARVIRLDELRSQWARTAHKDIFPMEQVFPEKEDTPEGDDAESLLICEILDAINTTYVNGRWMQKSCELHYRIATGCLPSSGDYTKAYYSSVLPFNDPAVSRLAGQRPFGPPHDIAAGLSYAAQFVSFLSCLLDCRPPARPVCPANLGRLDHTEYLLVSKVHRLNLSLSYLCLSQGVDAHLVRPRQTLYNLKLLLDHMQLREPGLGKKPRAYRTVTLGLDKLQGFVKDLPKDLEGLERSKDADDEEDEDDFLRQEDANDSWVLCEDLDLYVEDPGAAAASLYQQQQEQMQPSYASSIMTSLFRGLSLTSTTTPAATSPKK